MGQKDIIYLTKDVLYSAYFEEQRSTTDIAKEYNTNPKRISRLLKKYGYQARSRSEAQKLVVVDLHPTRGKERTEEERIAISKGGAASWNEDRKKVAANNATKQWEARTPEEKERIAKKASLGLQKAAKEGSKMEHHLKAFLEDQGHKVLHHDMALQKEQLEVDLWITDLDIIVEVDGIFHVEPVYGEDKLKKTQTADRKKNNLLCKNGFSVIRLVITKKNISDNDYRVIEEKLMKLVKSAKSGKVKKWRYDG